ncbi:MAG: S8 family serine peptidase, partial [Leptolyngbya sp. SIO4C1]|nr:S8 family serine peptidase [Leptolyngbya sp. SIO4C1]
GAEEKPVLAIVTLRSPQQFGIIPSGFTMRRSQIAQLQERTLATLQPSEFEVVHQYSSVAGFSGLLTHSGLQKLERNPNVAAIQLDRRGGANTAESVPKIRATEWAQIGIDGDGIAVAVLDSGLVNHPDLNDDLLLESCILSSNVAAGGTGCPDGSGQQLDEPGAALDVDGHGTNVTGIITSNGAIAPPGVAPGSEVVAIKVTDDQAAGQVSDLIAGLQYIVNLPPAAFNIRVVNISNGWFIANNECNLGLGQQTKNLVALLEQQGVLVVASSGNGSNGQNIDYPACVDGVFSVGATDDNDEVIGQSNSSPDLDLMAPGENITSTGISQTGLLTESGTSQAAPHVSACAALRLEDDPTLTPAKLKQILKVTDTLVTDPKNGLTFPRLRCGRPVLI